MNVREMITILATYPPDARVIVDTELGFDDVRVFAQPIAADYYRKRGICMPDSWAGPHAQADDMIDNIPATETAVLIARAP